MHGKSYKALVPTPIEDYRNIFILGRHMDDNILISHELRYIINKKRTGRRSLVPLKLEINKAYHLVSWFSILKS